MEEEEEEKEKISHIRSLTMKVFLTVGTSPLYHSQELSISFTAICLFCQKKFGKCKFQGVKGQGFKA